MAHLQRESSDQSGLEGKTDSEQTILSTCSDTFQATGIRPLPDLFLDVIFMIICLSMKEPCHHVAR